MKIRSIKYRSFYLWAYTRGQTGVRPHPQVNFRPFSPPPRQVYDNAQCSPKRPPGLKLCHKIYLFIISQHGHISLLEFFFKSESPCDTFKIRFIIFIFLPQNTMKNLVNPQKMDKKSAKNINTIRFLINKSRFFLNILFNDPQL